MHHLHVNCLALRRTFLLSIVSLFGAAFWNPAYCQELPNALEQRLKADVEYLASDEREGRGIGTQGLLDSGAMIAERFADLGLNTNLFGDSPYQVFTIQDGFEATEPADASQPAKNWFQITGQTHADPELGRHWMPLSLGANGEFSGQLVFAGYGISASDLHYDDYADLDVTGKVVIVIRKQPQQGRPDSRFGEAQNSRYAYFTTKETNAALQGAAALILVNDSVTADGEAGDRLFGVSDGGRAMGSKTIPTLHVLREFIDPIIQAGTGKSLRELEELIDQTDKPASQPLSNLVASGATDIQRKQTEVRNVVGLLPGRGSLANEYLVVGAHYDHVGMGGPGSLAPGTFEVHNGADDNASGTAVLLEVARQCSADDSENRRGILFIAFTAEERGLLGSKHYVRHPPIPIERTTAMINLDMVGRLEGGSLTAYGSGTAVEFPALLEELSRQTGLRLDLQAAGYGPSDHQSFHEVGLPVIHFFTGMHNQYHRPSDDAHLIDWRGMSLVAELTSGLTMNLAKRPQQLTRLRSEGRARIGPNAGRPRAVLGINLDGSSEQCVVSVVNENSPAMKAGIQIDDVIIGIGENLIQSTSDLLRAMRGYRVGDEVSVRVVRAGEEIELNAQLGSE